MIYEIDRQLVGLHTMPSCMISYSEVAVEKIEKLCKTFTLFTTHGQNIMKQRDQLIEVNNLATIPGN